MSTHTPSPADNQHAPAGQIFCKKYNRYLAAMLRQPFGGEQGKWVLENISQQAWNEWMIEQTKLINELRLNPLDPKVRAYLRNQSLRYLQGQTIEPFV